MNLIFAGYTGGKNQVRTRLKIKFVELDFSNWEFPNSSTDQQGVRVLGWSAPQPCMNYLDSDSRQRLLQLFQK